MGCTVRPIARQDREAWIAMREELWPGGSHEPDVDAFLEGRALEPLAVRIAQDETGAILGFIELNERSYAEGCQPGRVAYVEGWFVVPAARRRGVGTDLLEAAEGWARERGLRELASDTELGNAIAIRAHLASGFEEIERLVCFRKRIDG